MLNASARPPAPLPRATYLLLLLNADNGASIQGRTKLVKLAFLVQKRVVEGLKIGVSEESYSFRPLHYGPFTEEVFDDLAALQMLNLVSVVGDDPDSQNFMITDRGREAVRRLADEARVSSILMQEIGKVKVMYGRMPLNQLIDRVYHDYPEYTEKSEIKNRYLY